MGPPSRAVNEIYARRSLFSHPPRAGRCAWARAVPFPAAFLGNRGKPPSAGLPDYFCRWSALGSHLRWSGRFALSLTGRGGPALDHGDLVPRLVEVDFVHEGPDEQQPSTARPLQVGKVRRVG